MGMTTPDLKSRLRCIFKDHFLLVNSHSINISTYNFRNVCHFSRFKDNWIWILGNLRALLVWSRAKVKKRFDAVY